MTAASLIGIWIWRTGLVKSVFGVSMNWLVPALLMVTVLCRSTGALLLLAAGLGAMWAVQSFRTRLVLYALLLVAPIYVGIRTSGAWSGRQVIDFAGMIDEDRAQSIQFRIDNENILVAKALEKPWFGWGGWARSRVYDEWGKDLSVTDGHWVILLGTQGLLGMTTGFIILLLPTALLVRSFSVRELGSREMAAVLALGTITVLYAIDCLPNAMPNPVYMLAAGSVASVAVVGRKNADWLLQGATASTSDSQPKANSPSRRLYPICP
jgi:hypothetical protein